MYQVVLGFIPLPITPSKMETRINGRNEIVDMMDGGQMNILRDPALKEISFEFTIPHQNYPFASLADNAVGFATNALGSIGGSLVSAGAATGVLFELDRMMKAKEPFYLTVVRLGDGLNMIHAIDAYIEVTLEDYSIIEDANNGTDITVEVRLKEYKHYVTIELPKGFVTDNY